MTTAIIITIVIGVALLGSVGWAIAHPEDDEHEGYD